MSGGVDSAVAAACLVEGHDVVEHAPSDVRCAARIVRHVRQVAECFISPSCSGFSRALSAIMSSTILSRLTRRGNAELLRRL